MNGNCGQICGKTASNRAGQAGAERLDQAEQMAPATPGERGDETSPELRRAFSMLLRAGRGKAVHDSTESGTAMDSRPGAGGLPEVLRTAQLDLELIESMAESIIDQVTEAREYLGLVN